MRFFLAWTAAAALLNAAYLHFDLYKLEGKRPGDTLLVLGGIHGDEPGGYFTAAVLAQHYRIETGALWVAPNLNFDSLVRDRRGIYGDMNRKFAEIDANDSDAAIVEEVKKLIVDPQVDLILNLHDGHGFYRKTWKNAIFNPGAWGQTCIIDQKCITAAKYGDLDAIASQVSDDVNKVLAEEHHSFNVKNTKTKFTDEQMRLSLTYFAVRSGKAAFAIETSKNISDLDQKVFYQLHAIEAYLRLMGIGYTRDFNLTRAALRKLLPGEGTMKINGNILLDLDTLRNTLNFVPFKRSENSFEASHPLGAFFPEDGVYRINVGNRRLATVRPEFFAFDDSLASVGFTVDDRNVTAAIPSVVEVNDVFTVHVPEGYRVNVIGFSKAGYTNENGLEVRRKAIAPRFSLDRDGRVFRVEIYKDNAFCGMIGVRFPAKKEQ